MSAAPLDSDVHPKKFRKMKGPVRVASKAVYIAWAAAIRYPSSGDEYFLLAPDRGMLIDVARLNGLIIDLAKCSEVVVGPVSKTMRIAK